MTQKPDFTLIFAPEIVDHLRAIDKKYHKLIREMITEQLSYTPLEVTRNRKPLEPLRLLVQLGKFGSQNRFRVLYEVDMTEKMVFILAIGVKDREQLLIGGEEVNI